MSITLILSLITCEYTPALFCLSNHKLIQLAAGTGARDTEYGSDQAGVEQEGGTGEDEVSSPPAPAPLQQMRRGGARREGGVEDIREEQPTCPPTWYWPAAAPGTI